MSMLDTSSIAWGNVGVAATLVGALLVVSGCEDGVANEPPSTEDCNSGCHDEGDDRGLDDGSLPPLQCNGACKSFQQCINNTCQPAPSLPACAQRLLGVPLGVELAAPTSSYALQGVVSVDLGLGGGDALIIAYFDRFSVIPGRPDASSFALTAEPNDSFRIPLVGELTGDDIPDLLMSSFASGALLVYRGDGTGDFAPEQVVAPPRGQSYEGVLTGDFDGDGHDEVVAVLGDALHWLALDDGGLADQGEIGLAHRDVDLRFDPAGQLELWTAGPPIRTYRGPPWSGQDVALPFGAESSTLAFGRYTGRSDRDAMVATVFEGHTFLFMGDDAGALHGAEVEGFGFEAAAGDLDGDGLDELLVDTRHVVLGLAAGPPDEPLAAACVAELEGLEQGFATLTRHLTDPPVQVIGWDSWSRPTLYGIEMDP